MIERRAGHRYFLDGQGPLPSVTQILSHQRAVSFDGVPAQILADAAERGTRVHDAIAKHLDPFVFAQDYPLYAGYFWAWISFCEQRRFLVVLTEQMVASRRHQLCGTIDCLGLLDGKRALVDVKTGTAIAADLQTAAYHALALEWAKEDDAAPELKTFIGKDPNDLRRFAVELRPDATFTVHAYNSAADYREFIALLTAYYIVARRKRVAFVAS